VDKAEAAARTKKIIAVLGEKYRNPRTALEFNKPLELLVATILSAQCTDVQVNKVTPGLFKKYKSAKGFAEADQNQLQEDIKSTGFFRNKARNIKAACQKLVNNYRGKVPEQMEELVKLPGVGRKTANVILGNAFGKPGIACDTHVIRLSRRLGLSANSDPVKLEFDLAEIVPKRHWTDFSHLLINHGRARCKARKPDCPACEIAEYCPAANKPELW
jgi:endonuclease-3